MFSSFFKVNSNQINLFVKINSNNENIYFKRGGHLVLFFFQVKVMSIKDEEEKLLRPKQNEILLPIK